MCKVSALLTLLVAATVVHAKKSDGTLTTNESACEIIVQAYGVPKSSPNFEADKAQCKKAQRNCVDIEMLMRKSCAETMGEQYKAGTMWQQNVAIASNLSINQGAEHMTNYCFKGGIYGGGEMATASKVLAHCREIADICRKGEYPLSSGRVVNCNSFTVRENDLLVTARQSKTVWPVCDMAQNLYQKVSDQTADRMRMCDGYRNTAGASASGGPALKSNELGAADPAAASDGVGANGETPGWEEIPKSNYNFTEEDLNQNLNNPDYVKENPQQFPELRPKMPSEQKQTGFLNWLFGG